MASREAYTPPVRQPEGYRDGNNNKTPSQNDIANANANAGTQQGQPGTAALRVTSHRNEYLTPDQKMYYLCGQCNNTSGFKANDMLRCLTCGGMTMYKPRVKQYVLFLSIRYRGVADCVFLGSLSTRRIDVAWNDWGGTIKHGRRKDMVRAWED
jgi:DNA-directed RNA polymerase subunit RPC12/RpoP